MGHPGGDVNDVSRLQSVPFTTGNRATANLTFLLDMWIHQFATRDDRRSSILHDKDVRLVRVQFGRACALAHGEHRVVIAIAHQVAARKGLALFRKRLTDSLKIFRGVYVNMGLRGRHSGSERQ